MSPHDFRLYFELLTGHGPFPWQEALFAEFLQKRFPKTCDIPTGLGKTLTIAIWLLALAHHAGARTTANFPRRLAYVVNRRTVVDQSTGEAEQMREALVAKPELRTVADALRSLGARASDAPLAISTLRGQFADNGEWRDDPARPAVIVGTVDMVGSRLLFSGYGCGFKSRPAHAGFLGQDTLLIHDEAHLEPAFQELISAIESEQQRCREFSRLRVMALTATSRSSDGEPFGLTSADLHNDKVWKRLGAKKGISFRAVEDEKKTAELAAKLALEHKSTGHAILVFLRELKDVERVADKLRKAKLPVQVLTGTLRGRERDALAKEDPIFARFTPNASIPPAQGTVYLICTSAGEVGINISADHLVCDLTPFDSMAQRFGRVNRFGDGDAQIDVVYYKDVTTAHDVTASTSDNGQAGGDSENPHDAAGSESKTANAFERARELTLVLLNKLPKRDDDRCDASPAALRDLPAADRHVAFTPSPVILAASDILFDAWALTSIRQRLPGRPPVAEWLHGVAEWEPPETHVAWREEVECITGELLDRYESEELLEDYPLKPHEILGDRTSRVFGHLETIARRCPELSAWLIESDGKVRVVPMPELVKKDKQKKPVVSLAHCTVLLPPAAGGLRNGILDGAACFDDSPYDVADKWVGEKNEPRRRRVWDEDEPPLGMRLVRSIDTRLDAGDESDENQPTGRRYWYWYVQPRAADDDGSRTAREPQQLKPHLRSAECFASALVGSLVSGPEASAVVLAARWHDVGKDRAIWQRSIGNHRYPVLVLAKSGGKMRPIELTGYRHEFGSLLDVSNESEFCELSLDLQDLVLHLIAAHHGRARPHFPASEAFDPDYTDETAAAVAREVPRRFARLQRKYGRWGLAYLESLVRAADALASQGGEESESAGATATSTQEAAP